MECVPFQSAPWGTSYKISQLFHFLMFFGCGLGITQGHNNKCPIKTLEDCMIYMRVLQYYILITIL